MSKHGEAPVQLDHPEATKQKKHVCQTMQESIGCDLLQVYDLSQPLKVCRPKAQPNGFNMLMQRHPTLLNPT